MAFTDLSVRGPAVELLQRSLERGRIAQAYLFTGDRIGELEEVAGALACALNCLNPPRRGTGGTGTDSCDACALCRKIRARTHPDIHWLRPESKSRVITVDQVRGLIQAVNLKPTEAAYKMGVIADAERLNPQAANAFLKTLEEPPGTSVLILLSTEPQQLLETILSRCLRLNFATGGPVPLDPSGLEWLSDFGELAGNAASDVLARYRLLGRLAARLKDIREETERQLTRASPLERFPEAEPKVREKWEEELAAAVEAEYRRRRAELLGMLLWWLRDVWLLTLKVSEKLLCLSQASRGMRAVSERITPREAGENLRILENTQRLLDSNVQEALALEVGLLELKL